MQQFILFQKFSGDRRVFSAFAHLSLLEQEKIHIKMHILSNIRLYKCYNIYSE